jgi:hypothetical protein
MVNPVDVLINKLFVAVHPVEIADAIFALKLSKIYTTRLCQ